MKKNNYSSDPKEELATNKKTRTTIPLIMRCSRRRMISVRRQKRRICKKKKLSAEKICTTFMSKRAQLNQKMKESSLLLLSLDQTSPVKYRLINGVSESSGEYPWEEVVGYGKGLFVDRGIVIFETFVKLDLGYLISSSSSSSSQTSSSEYYLPLLDNRWRFIGEFQGLDEYQRIGSSLTFHF